MTHARVTNGGFGVVSDLTCDVTHEFERNLLPSATVGSGVGVADRAAQSRAAPSRPQRRDSQHGRLAAALRPGKERLRNQRPQRNGGRIDNTFLVAEIDTVFFKRPSKSIAVHDLCQRQLVVLRQRTTEDEAASNAVGGVKDRDLP